MKRNSLFLKLFVGNLLLVGAIALVIDLLLYQALVDHYSSQARVSQDRALVAFAASVEQSWPLGAADMDRQCKTLGAASGCRATVVAADGTVLADSEADPAHMENHCTPSRPEVMTALGGQAGEDIRQSPTLHVPYRYVASPIRHEGKIVAAVRTAMPARTLVEEGSFLRGVIAWSVVATLVSAAVLGLLITWIWYRPVREITQAARGIALGDLKTRVSVAGTSELAEMATALNEMRQSLSRQIEMIAAQKGNLQTVVTNLGEGVIDTSAAGDIVLANRAAVEMLLPPGADSPVGRRLQSVVRALDITDLYNRAQSSGHVVQASVEIEGVQGRQSLDVEAIPLRPGSDEGIAGLLVLRDVTTVARAAAMKAEFVANASHELRTPLATIRAAVESLEGVEPGDAESMAKMVQMLDRHVKRLEDLTRDLLDLHTLEAGRRTLRVEPLSVGSVVDWLRTTYTDPAKDKGVALTIDADESASLRTDRTLLELILQNLVDNALKFTPSGGKVAVRIDAREAAATLLVSDTGCGIPPQAQARVFERFFQVDPSRSGEPRVRGTGLGLAIVKHATDRLHGQVSLQSEVGKGTTVTVVLPQEEP